MTPIPMKIHANVPKKTQNPHPLQKMIIVDPPIRGESALRTRRCRRWGGSASQGRHAFGSGGLYGPPTSPQPHRGIGATVAGVAPGCELSTAMREPHSR